MQSSEPQVSTGGAWITADPIELPAPPLERFVIPVAPETFAVLERQDMQAAIAEVLVVLGPVIEAAAAGIRRIIAAFVEFSASLRSISPPVSGAAAALARLAEHLDLPSPDEWNASPGPSDLCWADTWDERAEDYFECGEPVGDNELGLCADHAARLRKVG